MYALRYTNLMVYIHFSCCIHSFIHSNFRNKCLQAQIYHVFCRKKGKKRQRKGYINYLGQIFAKRLNIVYLCVGKNVHFRNKMRIERVYYKLDGGHFFLIEYEDKKSRKYFLFLL